MSTGNTPAGPQTEDGQALVTLLSERASALDDRAERAELFHQAGLAAETRTDSPSTALDCYIRALEANPAHEATVDALLRLLDDPTLGGDAFEDGRIIRLSGVEMAVDLLCIRAERRLMAHDLVGAAEDLERILSETPEHRQALLLHQELHALDEDLAQMVRGVEMGARRLSEVTLDEDLQAVVSGISARLHVRSDGADQVALGGLRAAVERKPRDPGLRWALQDATAAQGRRESMIDLFRDESIHHNPGPMRLAAALDASVALMWDADKPQEALALLREALDDKDGPIPRLDEAVGLEVTALLARSADPRIELDVLRELGQRLDTPRRQAAVFTRIGGLILEGDIEPGGIEAEKALRYIEAAVEAEPGYRPALELLDEFHEEAPFPVKARDQLRRRAEQDRRPDLMLEAARLTLERLGHRDEALVLLRQAISMSEETDLLGPTSALDHLDAFVAGASEPSTDRQHIYEEAFLRLDSVSGRRLVLRRMVDAAIEDGDESTAANLLTRLIAIDPEDRFQVERLANLYDKLGAWRELGELRRGELDWLGDRDNAQALEVMYVLGRVCDIALDDKETALSWYRAILEREPDNLAGLNGAGRILVREERWEEMAQMIHQEMAHVAVPSEQAGMAFRLATLHERVLGDIGKAREYYEQVREANANHLPSLFGLVRVAEASGDWALWAELVSEWSTRERDNVLAGTLSCELAHVQEDRLGDLEAAYESYRVALDKLPKLELARLGMIRCLIRLGRSEDAAVVALERLTNDMPPEERADVLSAAMLLSQDESKATTVLLSEVGGHIPALLAAIRLDMARSDWALAAARVTAILPHLPNDPIRGGVARLAHLLQRLSSDQHAPGAAISPATLNDGAVDEISLLRIEAAYRDAGDFDGLARLMERRSKSTEEPLHAAAALSSLARCLHARGQYEGAIACYQQALARRVDFVPAAKATRLVYELLGSREGVAIASEVEGSIARDRNIAVKSFLTAGELRRKHLGDIEGAIQDFEHALRIDPADLTAFSTLREIYSVRADSPALYRLLERRVEAISDLDEKKRLLLIMAQVAYGRLKDREMAIACHLRVLDHDPNHIQSMRILAEFYQSGERWDRAVQSLRRVIGSTTDNNLMAMTWRQIAEIYDLRLSDAPRAIDAYQSVAECDPEDVPSLRRLAQLLHEARRWEDAARTYGQILQHERRRGLLMGDLMALATICEEGLGEPERAEQCLVQALRLNNQDLELQKLLVEHYKRHNETEKLKEHIGQATRQFSAIFAEDLRSSEPLEGLYQLAEWSGSADRLLRVATVASLLGLEEGPWAGARGPLVAMGDGKLPTRPIPVDMTGAALPSSLSMSLLHIIRYANNAVARQFPVNLRELGLSRRTRVSDRSNKARAILMWPSLYSLRDIVIHAVPSFEGPPRVFFHEQTLLVVPADGVERAAAGDADFLFQIGMALAPLSMGIGAFTTLEPHAFLTAVAGTVRRSVPAWLLDDPRSRHETISEERLLRNLTRLPENQIVAQALEVSGKLDADSVLNQRKLLIRAFERLAMTPLFDPLKPIQGCVRTHGDEALDSAIRFLLSDRYGKLREAVGIAIED